VPLLNTVVLLSSGASVTWAHHSIIAQSYENTNLALLLTVFLGCLFIRLQIGEYLDSIVRVKSTVYGSIFFLLTGFHGFHVTIGRIFLIVSLVKNYLLFITNKSLTSFELCAWY
jgi:heme/copper-type cytochrome/quinol oxidase subunit 3